MEIECGVLAGLCLVLRGGVVVFSVWDGVLCERGVSCVGVLRVMTETSKMANLALSRKKVISRPKPCSARLCVFGCVFGVCVGVLGGIVKCLVRRSWDTDNLATITSTPTTSTPVTSLLPPQPSPPPFPALQVETFFKYDRGAKQLRAVAARAFSVTTDACCLHPQHLKRERRPTLG